MSEDPICEYCPRTDITMEVKLRKGSLYACRKHEDILYNSTVKA